MSGPDLSALRIDERARRSPRRLGWRALVVALVVVLGGAAGLFFALRERAPEVEVATVRADKGGRAALLNASGYVTPRQRATIAAKITARESVVSRSGLRCRAAQAVLALTRRTPIAARRPALISSHVSGSGIARALTVKLPL